jgi:hypothetical protein
MIMIDVLSAGADASPLRGAPLKATHPSADIDVKLLMPATSGEVLQDTAAWLREAERRDERRLAEAFVVRAKEVPLVSEVWASWEPALDVTVIVSGRDLEGELRLYAIFRELAAALGNSNMGDLSVLPEPYAPDDAVLIFPS